MRNPYVHPKVGLKEGSHMKRLMDSGVPDPRDLADADAQFAIRTVVDFIRPYINDEMRIRCCSAEVWDTTRFAPTIVRNLKR